MRNKGITMIQIVITIIIMIILLVISIFYGQNVTSEARLATVYNEITENNVLSHDLLEGNYLRCGLLTDVTLLDNYPCKFTSYLAREHRWIRGDWQLLAWLKRNNNKLNLISKFKIYDNLRRSILPITQFILFFVLISLFIPIFYTILDKVIFKKSQNLEIVNAYKNFSLDFIGLKGEFVKTMLNFFFLPSDAYNSLNAIVKTIYR